MGEPWKYQSSWKTEDLFSNYYTQAEVDALLLINNISILASAPLNPAEGRVYLNSADSKIYIYYGAVWQVLHSLTPPTPPTLESGQLMGMLCLTYQL